MIFKLLKSWLLLNINLSISFKTQLTFSYTSLPFFHFYHLNVADIYCVTDECYLNKPLETNGHSLVYSFFTRYINTISLTQQNNLTTEAFSIPTSDKPPSYNSLFVKPNPSIQTNRPNTNQSLSSSNPSPFSYQQSIPTISRISSTTASTNSAYIIDDSELPPYPGIKAGSNC